MIVMLGIGLFLGTVFGFLLAAVLSANGGDDEWI